MIEEIRKKLSNSSIGRFFGEGVELQCIQFILKFAFKQPWPALVSQRSETLRALKAVARAASATITSFLLPLPFRPSLPFLFRLELADSSVSSARRL